jgi:hypothetical protein
VNTHRHMHMIGAAIERMHRAVERNRFLLNHPQRDGFV